MYDTVTRAPSVKVEADVLTLTAPAESAVDSPGGKTSAPGSSAVLKPASARRVVKVWPAAATEVMKNAHSHIAVGKKKKKATCPHQNKKKWGGEGTHTTTQNPLR